MRNYLQHAANGDSNDTQQAKEDAVDNESVNSDLSVGGMDDLGLS